MSSLKAESQKLKASVIAVDPGYDRVGIAVMEGSALIHSECFTPEKGAVSLRLGAVFQHVNAVIKKYAPDALAIETLFFTKNQKTAIHVAEARGVITLAGVEAGIPVFEYSPQEVKIAVSGSGNASKKGVIRMVEMLVPMGHKKRHDDEYDAIALAIAHQSSAKFRQARSGK
ncbi:MAG: crossover junction endodeoxyribonuclease RuvC [Patescibacteria group bacterium]